MSSQNPNNLHVSQSRQIYNFFLYLFLPKVNVYLFLIYINDADFFFKLSFEWLFWVNELKQTNRCHCVQLPSFCSEIFAVIYCLLQYSRSSLNFDRFVGWLFHLATKMKLTTCPPFKCQGVQLRNTMYWKGKIFFSPVFNENKVETLMDKSMSAIWKKATLSFTIVFILPA